MRARFLFVALIAFAALPAKADSYDGKWTVQGEDKGKRCGPYNMEITVRGTDFSAKAGFGSSTQQIKGTVSPDGSFTAGTGQVTVSGKFVGNTVTLDLLSQSCGVPRHGTGTRAP